MLRCNVGEPTAVYYTLLPNVYTCASSHHKMLNEVIHTHILG